MEIEQLLAQCGDFGRYQFMLLLLFCLINVLASINYYSQTIITFEPEHWCYADSLANKSIDEIRTIYASYPHPNCTPLHQTTTTKPLPSDVEFRGFLENFGLLSMFKYNTHESDGVTDGGPDAFRSLEASQSAGECERWIYNLDYGYTSMTSELNWVCQNAWKSTIGQSIFFVGSVIGSLVFGILADKFGRLHMLIIANLMAMLGNGLTVFGTTVTTFAMCRFIAGLATDTNFVMMYILVLEYIRPSMRTFGLNLCIGLFYCVGSVASPWVAVWLGDWRMYLVVTAVPGVVVVLFYVCVQESALWLISRNDIDGAVACFRRVAKFNGRTLRPEVFDEFRKACEERQLATKSTKAGEKATLLDLFQTPRLRKSTLILFFKSMVITLCYDAISRNVTGLGITPFAMFSLSATAIFPACVMLLLLQDRIGRKAMASSSLLLSGIFTAATGVALAYRNGGTDPVLLVTLAIVGRFGVTVAYNSAAQYATELIPTCVRGQGVAAVHVAGYALTFFSSYILYLGNIWLALPSLLLGVLCLAGAFLVLFLPETLNRTIPSTLAEGEEFGRGESIFDFSCLEARRRRRRVAEQQSTAADLMDSRTTIATLIT